MKPKFLLNMLLAIGIIIVILVSYFLVINAYVDEKLNSPSTEIIVCESGNWVNWYSENNKTIYLENNIYRCGNEFKVCDLVNGVNCVPSKEFYISMDGGTNVKLEMGSSVSVQVKRNRWYGTIIEEFPINYLYVFDLVEIPIKVKNIDLVWCHQLVLMVCSVIFISVFLIGFFNRDERREN